MCTNILVTQLLFCNVEKVTRHFAVFSNTGQSKRKPIWQSRVGIAKWLDMTSHETLYVSDIMNIYMKLKQMHIT